MAILICVLAGFAAAVAAPFVSRLSPRLAGWVLALVPAAVFAYLLAVGIPFKASYAWVPQLDVYLSFHLDGLSRFFALIVSGVAACVLVYSAAYIGGAPYAGRFYSYMLVFVGSMLGLVLSDNLVTLYVFFELTSLSSFLLIGLDASPEARRASRQALIITTAGGLALLVGVLLIGSAGGSYSISELLSQDGAVRASPVYPWTVSLVAFGAFTKSAQMPFHMWLPNAMVAPTPVSAFLHAAAMVKAGIYVLARFAPVLGETLLWAGLLTAFGGVTMVVAAWLALRELDLKRVLAYATIAGLGLMVMLLGVGTKAAVEACLTYVLVHACYKATLFMTAGHLQHHAGTRDIRELRGLRSAMPATFGVALLAGLSMAGVHPFVGAIGKDLSYEALLSHRLLLAAVFLASIGLVAAAALASLRPFFGHRQETERSPGLPEWWLGPGILAAAGLAFGLAPSLIDTSILSPALSATLGEAADVELHLWKGLTPAFLLGVLTIALGAAVYLAVSRVRHPLATIAAVFDTDRAYNFGLRTVRSTSRAVTENMQSGSLRQYLLVIFIAAAGLLGTMLALTMGGPLYFDVSAVRVHEWIIFAAILGAAAGALWVRSRLGVILLLSTVSYGVALVYLLVGAPDLAMTQLLVETLLAILVVLAFVDLPKLHSSSSRRRLVFDGAVAIASGVVVTLVMLTVVATPFDTSLVGFYNANSYVLAHGRNIVNVILVDFRALDTLGEITVIAVAGLSIFVLLRRNEERAAQHPPEKS